MPALLTRPMLAADLPACAAIDRPCAGAERAWDGADFFAWIGTRGQGGLVCESGGRVVGFVLYSVRAQQRRLCLHRIGIAPRWRRRGVGSRLLTHMRQWLRDYPDVALLALVHERDLPMQCFLRANGLRVVRVNHRRCGDDDAYLFATPVVEPAPEPVASEVNEEPS